MKFAFVSPSGAGKTTIVNWILKRFPSFSFSKSYTTRKPRGLEDQEYIFISEKEFLEKKEEGFFLESERVFSNFYGTPPIKDEDVIFNIDINGFYKLKNLFEIVSIGIIVDPHELKKRLLLRGDCNILERLKRYSFEMNAMKALDFLVINDKLDDALRTVESIFNIYIQKRRALHFLQTIE
jgi:guanylate kinase